MFSKQPKLFQDPHIAYPIYNLDLDFADYIKKSRKIITDHRPDGTPDSIIDANTPIELKPTQPVFSAKNPSQLKYGALLIHGLLDTPFMMKDVGMTLQSQGMLVRSIMLPGHGTVPGALLHVKYEDWLQAVKYGIASLKKEVEQIFLVGFSTGAVLSVYHSLQDPTQIAGIIMMAPAYKINSPFAFISGWNSKMPWLTPRANWLNISDEIDYTKTLSCPFNAVYQVYRLAQAIKKIDHTKQPPCPVWIASSYEDCIVDTQTTIKYFQHYTHSKNKMILYSEKPLQLTDSRITIRSSTYPDLNIVNFSHISIPISPLNPHYGIHGDCPFASHVDAKNNYVYCALDKPANIYYDILYRLKLTPFIRQRLSFNPDFDFMMKDMIEFVEAI